MTPAPSPDVDCSTCKFGEQCRPLAYIPPCYNHGPDSPERAAAQARDDVLTELFEASEHGGKALLDKLDSLRTEAHK